MLLSSDMLSACVFGKVSVTRTDGGYIFDRFMPAQKQAFDHTKERFPDLWDDYFRLNCDTDSGILLDILTDAPSVTFRIASVMPANGSDAVQADILVDGRLRRTVCGAGTYTVRLAPSAGGGTRRVSLLFPYFARLTLGGAEVPDGFTVTPAPRKGLWLAYGDSITHGLRASSPYRNYVGKLAVRSGYEIVNQANSGYVHDARTLCPLPDGRQPDIVTVAYGINDWGRKRREQNERDMVDFYARLTELFPSARIFMLSPIWTTSMGDKPREALGGLYSMFRDVAGLYEGRVVPVDGLNLVPHDAALFSPDGVHPADGGFAYYARRLMNTVEAAP